MGEISNIDDLKLHSMDFASRLHDMCLCPISKALMVDPVVCADSHTYERAAILEWLRNHRTSPVTNLPLEHQNVISSQVVRNLVHELVSSQQVGTDSAAAWHYSTGKLKWNEGSTEAARSHFQNATRLGNRQSEVAIKMLDLKRKAETELMEDSDWMFPTTKRQKTLQEQTMQEWMHLQPGSLVRVMESAGELRKRVEGYNRNLSGDFLGSDPTIRFVSKMAEFAGKIATVVTSDTDDKTFQLGLIGGSHAEVFWFPYTTVTLVQAADFKPSSCEGLHETYRTCRHSRYCI